MLDNIKWQNTHVIQVPERGERKNGEKLFEVMTKHFPNLRKCIHLHTLPALKTWKESQISESNSEVKRQRQSQKPGIMNKSGKEKKKNDTFYREEQQFIAD